MNERPLHDHSLETLFAPLLAPFKRVVLAVSGGSDSMALMVLAARWIASGQAPHDLVIDVATVDHRLRAGSSREADWVADRAKALGFQHTTLVWSGDKPDASIQERAREARYALLAAHARGGAPSAVVTAHTADDQAETLLMRLGRGSGLDGLSGMAPSRLLLPDGSVHLVRPLLGLSKEQLAGTLKKTDGAWLDDPSNERLDFERVRLRMAREHLSALGLSNEKLALSAARLLRVRDALEQITEARLAALVDQHNGVFASVAQEVWRGEPGEVRVRMLARLLAAFGGDAKPAQLSQVEALEAVLAQGMPFAQTLGGCIVSQGRTTLRLYREPGHHALPEMMLSRGGEALWDWRFRVRYEPHEPLEGEGDGEGEAGGAPAPSPQAVSVRPLGLAAYATLKDGLSPYSRPPARAAAGLPAFWDGDRLLAVPSLQSDSRFTAQFLGLKRGTR